MRRTTPHFAAAPRGKSPDPRDILNIARSFGLRALENNEIFAAREIAQARFSAPIVSAVLMASVQKITRSSLFTFEQDTIKTAFLAFFPLRPAGLQAIERFAFNPFDFDLTLVARPFEEPAAIYGWGFAANTDAGGRAVVRGLATIQGALFWAIPKYCHVATEDGERVVIGKMGYQRVAGPDPNLAVITPTAQPTRVAA
jgi:hypothetical protein